MSRTWIWVLVGVGVVAAIAIGVIANHGRDSSRSEQKAESSYCSDVSALKSSVSSLTALDPTSASKSDYQDAVNQVESDWSAVQSSAADVKSSAQSQLENAWNTFQSSVQKVPSDASVSDALGDIKSAADTLESSAQSALSSPDCSSS
jgi:hypothetical protein